MIQHRMFRIVIFCVVILVGIILYLIATLKLNSDLLKSIGIELSAAGFIAILLELILRDEFIEVIKREFRPPLKELEMGIKAGSTFFDNFNKAHDKIDIIALSCTMGITNYGKLFIDKIYNEYCDIRILMLDPESELIKKRARDEPDNNAEERIRREIKKSIEFFRNLKSSIDKNYKPENPPKGSICVKTHMSIPYFGYTRMDNCCFVSLYFIGVFGIHSPVIEVRTLEESNSQLFHRLEKHFDMLWGRDEAKTVIDIEFFDRPNEDADGH